MKGIKLKVWKEGKRFLSMTLCAALIGGMLSGAAIPAVDAQAAEIAATIQEDFEDGKYAGFVRSEGVQDNPKIEVVDEGREGGKALKLSNRGANWYSYAYGVSDYVGMTATLQAYVKTEDKDVVCEITGVGSDGKDYWNWMHNVQTTSADEWVLLEKTFEIPAGASALYFSTGTGKADYLLDDVKITFEGASEYVYGDNLIKDPNFEDAELASWQDGKGGATLTAHTAEKAIFDEVKTYASISKRTDDKSGNGECFQQDITDVVKSGTTYKYSFYVMLDAEDYKDAPAGKREVCFGPFAGAGTYWGSYSTGVLDNNCVKTDITPGEWVKVEGEFTPTFSAGEKVRIRIIEQGTNYGADNDSSVRGTFNVTGVSLQEKIKKAEPEAYAITDLETFKGQEVSANTVDGKMEVEFGSNYKTLYVKIPRTVNAKSLEKVSFDVESVSCNSVSANGIGLLAFKVLTQAQKDAGEGELFASYGNPEISNFEEIYKKANGEDLAYVAIMSCYNTNNYTAEQIGTIKAVLSGVTFTFSKTGKENYFIEEGIPSLYDAVKDTGISMGVAVPVGALGDQERMNLVYKHYNSVTCENEMKPESILGSAEPGVDKIEDVKLNFTNADAMMDAVVSANNAGKANIKVRGHVLVWHSQTPAWFFREGFKNDGAYVTPEVMNQRMKWYITEVLTHFSEKYGNDLFYAWDVVNEAADDSGIPRQNGDWKGVYGNSTEYITNAFKYADEVLTGLGDDDMILFYNDYNECTPTKCDIIVKYLTDIRKVIGAGRKLGAGMQGHHDMASPTLDTIENATRRYAAVADVVHITELDIKSSMGFDGVDLKGEAMKQGHRYREIFEMVQRVNADDLKGDVENITIWGTHDAASWLKTSNSVGGSADGKTPQFPLLFDDDLKAKPAYWAFVDADKLEPYIQEVAALNTQNFAYASEYEYAAADTKVVIKPIWSDGKVQLQISVSKALGAADTITVYADTDATGAAKVAQVAAADLEDNTVVVDIPVKDLAVNQTIGFDVVVVKDGKAYPYNDTKGTSAETSKYYAKLTTKPLMEIVKGTACVDGDKSDWDAIDAVELNVRQATTEATATAKVSWDEENLYVLMDVKDANLDDANTQAHEQDSMELFIDELNEKAGSFDNNDKQYRVSYKNVQSCNGPSCKEEYITSATKEVEGGYVIEAAIKWTELKAKAGELVGIDLQINDAKDGKRIGTANWYDASGNGYQNPSVYGTAVLVETEVAKPDQSFAKQVEGAIRAIGTVSYDDASKAKIDAAKAAFSKLSVAQRAYVSQEAIDILYAAEKKYADLKAAAEKAAEEALKKDEATVADAVAKIKAIGTVTTDAASKAKIDAARAAYNALTAEQKAKIDAATVKVLTDAETTYKAEVQKAEDAKYFAKFSVKSVPLKVKQSSDVLAKDIQIAAGDKVVKWESSNKNIVSVTSKGKITGKKAGTAKITATTEKGKTATITVKVQKATVVTKTIKVTNKVTGDTIKSGKTVSLKKGKKLTVAAKVTPMTTKDKVKFTTSNKKVATVNSKGVITGKKKGTATITVKSGKKTFKFKVKVK